MTTNYRRRQYLNEQIKLWHMNDAKSLPPTRYFTEEQLIASVAGSFLCGVAVAVLVMVMLSLD